MRSTASGATPTSGPGTSGARVVTGSSARGTWHVVSSGQRTREDRTGGVCGLKAKVAPGADREYGGRHGVLAVSRGGARRCVVHLQRAPSDGRGVPPRDGQLLRGLADDRARAP